MTSPVDASAAPRREPGVRSRAGNAMQRTRVAVLDGAARAVEKYGARKATMADIASLAGIAKGTLYNHFRTKEAVYAAAVDAAVRQLGEDCAALASTDLVAALALAADRVGTWPALRRVVADEPAVAMVLVTPSDRGSWPAAREAVARVLEVAGRRSDTASVEVVLRWVVSCVTAPADEPRAQAAMLVAGLGHDDPTAAAMRTSVDAAPSLAH